MWVESTWTQGFRSQGDCFSGVCCFLGTRTEIITKKHVRCCWETVVGLRPEFSGFLVIFLSSFSMLFSFMYVFCFCAAHDIKKINNWFPKAMRTQLLWYSGKHNLVTLQTLRRPEWHLQMHSGNESSWYCRIESNCTTKFVDAIFYANLMMINCNDYNVLCAICNGWLPWILPIIQHVLF